MTDQSKDHRDNAVDLVAAQIGELLGSIDRRDDWSARVYAEGCFRAALDQLRDTMPEAAVIEYLRFLADSSERLLLHVQRRTGGRYG